MANGYLKKQYKGKGTVGSDMLEKIHKNYIDLSLMWLLTGEGTMLEEITETTADPQVEEGEGSYTIVKDDIITLLREQVAILEKSLADKEKIILMLEGKLRKLNTRQ